MNSTNAPPAAPAPLGTRRIAERYAVTSRTVLRWIGSGDLPAERVGGQWRVSESSLRAFVARGRHQPS